MDPINKSEQEKIFSLKDISPLNNRINEIESLLWRLAEVNKHLLEMNLKKAGMPQLSKENYKVTEVSKLVGLSRTTLRAMINDGVIMKSKASTIGLILIPKSEIERLLEGKNLKVEKLNREQQLLDAIAKGEVAGLSMSRTRKKSI